MCTFIFAWRMHVTWMGNACRLHSAEVHQWGLSFGIHMPNGISIVESHACMTIAHPMSLCMRANMSSEATGRFLTLYDALAMLEGSAEVFVSWLVLECNAAAIGVFDPSAVCARRLPHCDQDHRIWEEKPTRARRGRPGGAQEFEPLGDGGAAGDEDEPEADESRPEEEVAGDGFDLEAELQELLEQAEDLAEHGFMADGDDVFGGEWPPEVAGAVVARPAAADAAPPPAPPAPLSPPVALAAAAQPGNRRGAEVTYYVPGGSISFYRSKNAFEAVCDHPAHGRCVLTRTARGKAAGGEGIPRGGRPVGFLAAWLSAGADCATKADHWQPERLRNVQADRLALRQRIAETPEGARLLTYERAQSAGEEVEPSDLRGLL